MLNVVAVMFLNLTLSSFLHKCRSTASTQVHLQVGRIQQVNQVILQVSQLQWNIVICKSKFFNHGLLEDE